jgi:hypothetical protein
MLLGLEVTKGKVKDKDRATEAKDRATKEMLLGREAILTIQTKAKDRATKAKDKDKDQWSILVEI